jgi:DNA-binding response OmpR family regulator
MTAGSPLVLVVDDDPSVRKSLTRLLASAGYAVEAFASAREFLARPARPHRDPVAGTAGGPGSPHVDRVRLRPRRRQERGFLSPRFSGR